MNPHQDHYRVLGLAPSASEAEISDAVQHLCDEAAVLVYTSPGRSHELWERARSIREDLLADPVRRASYDLFLPDLRAAAHEAETAALARAEDAALLVDTREWFWPALLGGAGAALAVIVMALILIRFHAPSTHGQVALALFSSGRQTSDGYLSGHTVRLHWNRVPQALVYRIQIDAVRPSGAPTFVHPTVSQMTLGTSYSMRVVGPRVYYWRVQAYVHDGWSGYSRSQHFAVVTPPAPVAVLTPVIRIARAEPVSHAGCHGCGQAGRVHVTASVREVALRTGGTRASGVHSRSVQVVPAVVKARPVLWVRPAAVPAVPSAAPPTGPGRPARTPARTPASPAPATKAPGVPVRHVVPAPPATAAPRSSTPPTASPPTPSPVPTTPPPPAATPASSGSPLIVVPPAVNRGRAPAPGSTSARSSTTTVGTSAPVGATSSVSSFSAPVPSPTAPQPEWPGHGNHGHHGHAHGHGDGDGDGDD